MLSFPSPPFSGMDSRLGGGVGSPPRPPLAPQEQRLDLYIFCSYRFTEPVTRAVQKLADALAAAPFNIRLHTVNAEHGGSIRGTVFKDLEGSRMAVIIGTRMWGEKTSTAGCTFDEWDFIEDRNKPRYLINMLAPGEEFKVSTTVPIFRNHLIEKWAPNASTGEWDAPPQRLVEDIVRQFDKCKHTWTQEQFTREISWSDVKVDEAFDGGFEDEPSRVGGGGNGMVYKAKLQTVDIYGVPNEMEDVVVKRVWMRGQAGSAVEAHKMALQEAEMTAMTERMVQERDLIAHVHGVARGRLTNPHHTDLAAALSVPLGPLGAECVGIVMRYEAGGSLRDLVNASTLPPSDPKYRPLPLVEIVRIAHDVARALDQVHTCAGVLHGDVKPDNIFLSHHVPPKVRLGDFGFADSLLQGATMGLSVSVAARGGVRGTYWYMSPEMLKHVLTRARLGSQAGAHATRFSEVYALAITLAVMLTKKQPYEEYADTLDDNALFEGVTREVDPLRPSLPLDTPPELRALIEECWSADRRARPLPREIARRLRGVMQSLPPTPTHSPNHVPAPSPGSDPLEAMRAQLVTLQARLDQVEVLC